MGDKAKANATFDQAIALAQKEVQVNPRDSAALGLLGLFYANKGDDRQAAQYIHRARSIDEKDVGLIYDSAVVNTLGGRQDDAIKDLRDAVKNGYSLGQVRDDPDFQALSSNPAFSQLLK
jgi:Flp pilus assembly protein TadD